MNIFKKFDDYDNFYTILTKRKLTAKYTVIKIYKIIYGHFIPDTFEENIFEYKTVFNGKIDNSGITHKCTLENLQKPNSREDYYQFLTYDEIYKIKQYLVNNTTETEYIPPTK